MLPPTAGSDIASEAERRMYEVIRQGLSDDWFALHSLGIRSHATKPWAEIDFALIGPAGIYCLEVKGGRVARRGGQWVFTNRAGNESLKREGPFEQAAGASAALANYLAHEDRSLTAAPVGHGVVFPDVEFTAGGPDIAPEVIYDAGDSVQPFSAYVARLASHWRAVLTEKTRITPRELSATEIKRAVTLLRADFDARPSLQAEIRRVNLELLRLTAEQYRALDGLAENRRVLITGAAGTGKTLLALEEAIRAARQGERVLMLCFSRHLAQFLRERTADQPSITTTTLHAFMNDLIERSGRRGELPRASEADLLALFHPRLAASILRADAALGFDVMIVDEAQDLLTSTYIDVMDAAVRGGLRNGTWRVFFDPLQNIFDGVAVDPLRILRELELAHFKLSLNCRNTEAIGTATALLADVECAQVLRTEGPEVNYVWYGSLLERRTKVTEELRRLLDGGVPAGNIVILGRTVEGVSEGIAAARVAGAEGARGHTIASFKGLEADAIVLTGVDQLDTPEADKLMYVGVSRAKVWLSILLDLSVKKSYNALAGKLGQRLRRQHS